MSTATTSLEALRRHTATGAKETNLSAVLRCVASHPGATPSEIAERIGIGPVEVRRRLTDGKNAGLLLQGTPRKTRGDVRRELTWFPALKQGVLL